MIDDPTLRKSKIFLKKILKIAENSGKLTGIGYVCYIFKSFRV